MALSVKTYILNKAFLGGALGDNNNFLMLIGACMMSEWLLHCSFLSLTLILLPSC